jgi:menaquinone-dependent protoporphyrinogen IX oxidase
METIEDIIKNWDADSVIDSTEPGKELLKIPTLHNKYLKFLVKHKLAVKRLNFEYAKMRRIKEEYYNGSLSKEELDEYDWEPFLLNVKTKMGVEKYLESDKDLIKILEKKIHHDEAVSICESILQELKSRTFQLRDYISWERFIGGN